MAPAAFMPVSAIPFIDVSFIAPAFMPVSAGAGAIAGAVVAVESAGGVPLSFGLHAASASTAATRARRFIDNSPDQGVEAMLGVGGKLRITCVVSRPVR